MTATVRITGEELRLHHGGDRRIGQRFERRPPLGQLNRVAPRVRRQRIAD